LGLRVGLLLQEVLIGNVQVLLVQGLLLLTCGVYGNVLRFLFPLTIEDTVFEEALVILDDVIGA
jgi:4-aminobutyrate aminotransferase-like enzyme